MSGIYGFVVDEYTNEDLLQEIYLAFRNVSPHKIVVYFVSPVVSDVLKSRWPIEYMKFDAMVVGNFEFISVANKSEIPNLAGNEVVLYV